MCTVTWLQDEQGYHVFCNRDEWLSRPAARPPQVEHCGMVNILAPIDPVGGGTWIGVNQHGLSAVLLNRFPETVSRDIAESRGLITSNVLESSDIQGAVSRTIAMDLHNTNPFLLVLFSRKSPPIGLHWQHDALTVTHIETTTMPLTSSETTPDNVWRERHALLTDFYPLTAERLAAYHRLPQLEPVHEAAGTVSLTVVRVDERFALMQYYSGAPCQVSDFDETRLECMPPDKVG